MMMTFEARDDMRLNEKEAEWIGYPAGTPLQDLPKSALRVLTRRHFDERLAEYFHFKHYSNILGPSWWAFNNGRLATLAVLLGTETFDLIAAEKAAQWEQQCAEADAAERALPPCVICKRSRKLADEAFHKEDGLCGDCARERWERGHPFSADGDEDPTLGEDDIF